MSSRPLFGRSDWYYVDKARPRFIKMRVAATCKRIVDAPVPLHYTLINLFKAGPLQLVISENFREIEGLKKFYRAKKQIADWNITRISAAFARLWLETPRGIVLPGGETLPAGLVLPLVIRCEEMGKIARSLGVEMADLAKYILGVKDNNLFLTGRIKDNNDLTNEQIRRTIADYLGRRTDKKPPTLFADLFKDFLKRPSVMLGRAPDGSQLILSVKHLKDFEDFSMAGITFLSREQVEVAFYVRRLDGLMYKERFIQELDLARPETLAPKMIETPLPKIARVEDEIEDLRGKSKQQISGRLTQWLFDENDKKKLLYDRNIKKGKLRLGAINHINYDLPGRTNLLGQMKEGLLLLEKTDGKDPTATLFPIDSDPSREADKKVAVWRLPVGEPYRGILIYPKAV